MQSARSILRSFGKAALPLLLTVLVLRTAPGQITINSSSTLAGPTKVFSQKSTRAEVPVGNSIIRGRVIYADSRHPLRRATVSLIGQTPLEGPGTAMTNRRGEFEIRRVPAGQYLLAIEAPGIISADMLTESRRNRGQVMVGELRELFTEVVVDGTNSVEVQLQARRGGVITGRVLTDDDQPVADANVRLFRFRNRKLLPVQPTWQKYESGRGVKTDPDGVYRIAGLPSGDYLVRISEGSVAHNWPGDDDDSFSDGSLMVVYHPRAASIKSAQPVKVVEGSETTGIDIRIPERDSHTIAGRVTHGPNNDPGGFTEIKIDRTDEGHHAGFSILDVSVRADSDGRWEVRGVPSGEYLVTINGTVRGGEANDGRHINIARKTISVRVADADVTDLNIKVSPGAIVFGTLNIDGKPPTDRYGINPHLQLASDGSSARTGRQGGQPSTASAESLVVESPDFTRGIGGFVQEDGKFSINGLSGGRYWFQLSGFDAEKYYVKSITARGINLMETPLELKGESDFGGVVVTLSTDLATVEGIVVAPRDSKSKSFRGAVVVVSPANDLTRRFSEGLRITKVDAQGRFVFKCAPGEYFVAALSPVQLSQLANNLDEKYFQQNNQAFARIKVRANEKLRGVSVFMSDK